MGPLENALRAANLPVQVCADFMWMMEQPQGTHHYKHRDSRCYATLTADADALDATAKVLGAISGRRIEVLR
jgi:ornithine carbamoyltransferase